MIFDIHHKTIYRYAQPVQFGPHQLLLRPREGHDLKVLSSSLDISPSARVRWKYDQWDNSMALVEFTGLADTLVIDSRVRVEQFNLNPFDFVLEPAAVEAPFRYPDSFAADLGPFLLMEHFGDRPAIDAWLRPFLGLNGRARTIDLLMALTRSVPLFFQYRRREEAGVQNPSDTLRQRSGSCRDFALLMVEAARSLGLAARFVSGYLCGGPEDKIAIADQSTHAWVEVFLPGAGWKGFDPTGGIAASERHVRTAIARTPVEAAPITGSYVGAPNLSMGMEVSVSASHLALVPFPAQAQTQFQSP